MAIPDYQALMLPVLLAASKGEARIGQVVDQLADELPLTSEERNELLASGKQTVFSNRVHWAKAYLNKAQLVAMTRRAHFQLTPRGQQVLASNPLRIDNHFLMQFEEFRQFKKKSSGTAVPSDHQPVATALEDHNQTPDEVMRTAPPSD